MENLKHRITLNYEVMKGKPTIRNMRFSVAQMLEMLASGMGQDDILADYPFLEKEDIQACLWYASQMANTKHIAPLVNA
jgi:uncharacterized protein (DUF433 family)